MNWEGVVQGVKLMTMGMSGVTVTCLLLWGAIRAMRRLFPPNANTADKPTEGSRG